MKRIVCVFLCFCMLISLGFLADGATFTPPILSENTYTVTSASQLRWISAVCSGLISEGTENYPSNPSFEGYTIVLKNNVSVASVSSFDGEYILAGGEEWIPIGTEKIPFKGIFDGNECSVSGIFVGHENDIGGFFGVSDGGIVKNLTVKGYVYGDKNAGGIVGKANGEISGCVFAGKVEGNARTGGIVGEISGSSEARSKVYLNVSACNVASNGGECAGGIAAYAEYTDIFSCSGGVDLYSYSRYTAGVLGLAGEAVNISCCNSEGILTADGEQAVSGGILGASLEEAILINNSFSGVVYCSSSNMSICGGIAGSFSGKIENSFVNGAVYSALYFEEVLDLSPEESKETTVESSELLYEEISEVVSEDFSELVSEDVSEETSEEDIPPAEKICISAGIVANPLGVSINNCYFSGISECEGLKGFDLFPDGSDVSVKNTFYSYGMAYILYGTNTKYHVQALFESLTSWVKAAGTEYSSWQQILGVNETKPLLKHSNAAGSNGKHAWKVEGTTFSFYIDGEMDDYFENQYGIIDTPWVVYRATVRTVKIKDGVTRIGNNAFNTFDALRALEFPSTLKEIGDYSFENCTYLKNFTIPDGVEDIGEGAFRQCKNLTSISLPKGIRAVRKHTFSNCAKLKTINIQNSVSLIGYMAFYACDALITVNLPESVREIDDYAFYYCDNFSTVTLPSNLNRIGQYAFGRCEKLVYYDIPLSTKVEKNAFWSVEPRGDVDCDGKYTVFDYLKIKAHFLGVSKLTKEQIKESDSDFDGRVSTADYLAVKKYILNQE
ncbi:MAG: hypothetical protein E7614_04265 [Ruminococcaceae bacterium]|nr:hypothetical protein [Oscillospiraceae bacterium]